MSQHDSQKKKKSVTAQFMSATKSPHIEQECIFYYFIIKWHKYKILLNVYVLLLNSFFFWDVIYLFFFLEEFINVTPLIKSKKLTPLTLQVQIIIFFFFLRAFKSSSLIFMSFSFYKRNKCLYIIFKCVSFFLSSSFFFFFFNYEHYNSFFLLL